MLVAVVAVAFVGVSSRPTSPVSPEGVTMPRLVADVYPLYGTGPWSMPVAESFIVGTTTYTGVSASFVAATSTMNPAAVFAPFENYYDQKLKASGYTIDNSLAAGGHMGGQTAYRKGSSLVLTRFRIDYHTVPKDAPSTCPCDVTLSLFSATSTPQ